MITGTFGLHLRMFLIKVSCAYTKAACAFVNRQVAEPFLRLVERT